MIRALCFLLVIAASTPVAAQPSVEAPLDRVLGAVVASDGRVDYDRLARQHRGDLNDALEAVARVDPAGLRTDAQKTAFLVNAYNAHVLRLVLEHRATHLERQGLFEAFFQTPVVVAGRRMTLNQLEHGVLRRQNRVDGEALPRSLRALRPSRLDPRIHAAVNCAAVSCPPLQRRAYKAAGLDRDLDAVFSAFVNSSPAARLDGRRVVLSSIFDWFADDFEAAGRPLGDAILSAMSPRRPDAAAIRERLAGASATDLKRDRSVRFAYDWTVNRRKRRGLAAAVARGHLAVCLLSLPWLLAFCKSTFRTAAFPSAPSRRPTSGRPGWRATPSITPRSTGGRSGPFACSHST